MFLYFHNLNSLTNQSVDTTKQDSITQTSTNITSNLKPTQTITITSSIDENNLSTVSKFSSKLTQKQPTQLDFGTYSLPIQGEKAYIETIETRPPYTSYGAFLSSDYMMKRLKYFPEYESRMNSNEWMLNSTNRSGTTIIGENVNLKIKDSIILDGGITANNKLNIDTQGNLSSTAELKSKGDMSINVLGEINSKDSTNVYSTLNNPVKEVKVHVGDKVKAGDVLAILDSGSLEKDVKQSEATTVAAEANAKSDLESKKKAYDNASYLYNNLSSSL